MGFLYGRAGRSTARTCVCRPGQLRRRLIAYDRRSDLLPLLSVHQRQPSALAGGFEPQYDFGRVERALAGAVLAGRAPVVVQVRNFPYAGELGRGGQLARLYEGRLPFSTAIA
jgi:hypothetical protein